MFRKIIVAVFLCVILFIGVQVQRYVYKGRIEKGKNELSYQAEVENASSDNEEKIAYLTFDDGPSDVTKEVLAVLKENEIVATFFLIGSQINDDMKPVLEEMIENKNIIGVHTYSHKSKQMYASKEAYLEDFNMTCDVIEQVVGVKPKIWRFPWGSANSYISSYGDEVIYELEQKGFRYFDWNVTAEDSVGNPTPYSILQNINKGLKKQDEAVILMHDGKVNGLTARLLPQIIQQLKTEGYRFDTLDHMKKPFQWPRD